MLKPAHHNGEAITPDLPAGFDIPGLELLTSSATMLSMINGCLPDTAMLFIRCEVVNLRFKNPRSCLITYRLFAQTDGSDKPAEAYVYARGFGVSEFGAAVPQLATTRWVNSEWGLSVTVLPELSAILYWFPNDERLHGLRRITLNKKLQRVLYDHMSEYPADTWRISNRSIRSQILRYKPERRVVTRCRFRAHRHSDNLRHERFVYMGVYEGDRHRYLSRVLSDLQSHETHNSSWKVPTPLATVDEHGLLITEELDGNSLRTILEGDSQAIELNDVIRTIVSALTELHGVNTTSLPIQTHEHVTRSLNDSRDRLVRFVPDCARRVERLMETLCKSLPELPANQGNWVHGDLHPGQIIVGNGPVGFIDFDRAHIGDPIEDLGNFRAQLWINYATEETTDFSNRWIDAYRDVCNVSVTDSALNLWTSIALVHSALRPIGRLEPNWRVKTEAILKQAEEVLA